MSTFLYPDLGAPMWDLKNAVFSVLARRLHGFAVLEVRVRDRGHLDAGSGVEVAGQEPHRVSGGLGSQEGPENHELNPINPGTRSP